MYFSDLTNSSLDVIDSHRQRLIKQISGFTNGPGGVVVDSLGHVWAGNGDGTVVVAQARGPFKKLGAVKVGGPSADELAYDPIHHIIAATSPDAITPGGHAPAPHVTLINAQADRKGKFRVIGEVAIPGAGPGSIEQPQWDAHNKVFVEAIRATTDFPHGEVAVIDPIHVRLQALLPIDGQCNPGGLAVGPGDQALLGCNVGAPAIINTSTGRILKPLFRPPGGMLRRPGMVQPG